ncbi:MAG: hypothetical protein AABZ31_08505 [Bdellovibrionota bacterium]
MQKLSIFTSMLILLVSFQNCSTGFEGSGEGDTSSSSSSTGNEPGTTPPPTAPPVTPPVIPPIQPPPVPPPVTPPVTKKALVTVGVGVGGRIISGLNGFETLIYDHEVFSPAEQNSIKADPNNPKKVICHAGWMQIGSVCCLAQYECIGGGWHSDFLFRGIAFGNGHFVAVGGQIHGIVQVSADGFSWAPKINLVAQSG